MEDKIKYYQTRHRLSIKQISELREFEGIEITYAESKKKVISSMTKVSELIHLSDLFRNNELNFISLKGPILSWRLHKDFLFRHSGDLDILVEINDLDKTIELIKKEGYKSIKFDIPKTKNKRALVLKFNNQIAFFHPQKKILLEIHWSLMKFPPISKSKFNQILKQNLDTVVTYKRSFTVFNKEFEFVFLIMHGAFHSWRRLKWLHDIYAYSKDEELSWNKIFILSDHFKVRHLVFQALHLADHYWILANEIKQSYLPDIENTNQFIKEYPIERINSEYMPSGFSNRIKYAYRHIRYYLLLFSGFRYKTSYIKRLLIFEGEKDISNFPDSLTFLYFVFRPINFIYMKTIGRLKKIQIK